MCIACGDLSTTQASVSALPSFLLATSPLGMLLWYRFSKRIRIAYISEAQTNRQYMVSIATIQIYVLLLNMFLLWVWQWNLSWFVLITISVYILILFWVAHSFVYRNRRMSETIHYSVLFSLSTGSITVLIHYLEKITGVYGNYFYMLRDIYLLFFSCTPFLLFTISRFIQLSKKR